MEPAYKGFRDLIDFYGNYGYHPETYKPNEDNPARNALSCLHNHTCWLNPVGGFNSKRTKKLCKKFWKDRQKIELKGHIGLCDMCPNCITYYKNEEDFLFALGNSYLYREQGKIE